MDRLRIGVALYNAGHYLAAHEPLETLWLEKPASERDDCLQGLIQAAAAIHKAQVGNATGATGLADSARGYLDACDAVEVGKLAAWLGELETDPGGDREAPPELRVDGKSVGLHGLSPTEIVVAGAAVAETTDDDLLESAVEHADADLDGSASDPLVALLVDWLAEPTTTVRQRLEAHVDRREMRESDVEGLF
jgi:hypothetical protein